ncbi:MAG: 5-dehydro-2-deoxygluconokinase [Kiloniellales bacterium]|nr:5-dehydro-2-deoxygluconokinase [Kiloniellales bacterium]
MSDGDVLSVLDRGRPLGALILGRAGMDLYPVEDGGKIAGAEGFTSDVGGSAGNIAVAMARQGATVGLIGAVSDDPVGRFVLRRLEAFGVDTASVRRVDGDPRTSLALAEVRAEDCEVTIYRNNAADLQLKADAALLARVGTAGLLIVTGTALVADPSRGAALALLEAARAAGTATVFDLDYRAYSWRSQAETAEVYGAAADLSDLVVGNAEEFAVFAGDGAAAARRLTEGGRRIVVLKAGAKGAVALGPGWRIDSGIFPVEARKPYGAGDAFLGNLANALLQGRDLAEALRRGAAAAAIVVAKRGCASAMPDKAELESFLASRQMTREPIKATAE